MAHFLNQCPLKETGMLKAELGNFAVEGEVQFLYNKPHNEDIYNHNVLQHYYDDEECSLRAGVHCCTHC